MKIVYHKTLCPFLPYKIIFIYICITKQIINKNMQQISGKVLWQREGGDLGMFILIVRSYLLCLDIPLSMFQTNNHPDFIMPEWLLTLCY